MTRQSLSLAPPRGHSLVEVMVAVVVLGILSAAAVPSYRRAVEQVHVDRAATNLRAIWAAERLYYLEHRAYAGRLEDLGATGALDVALLAADGRFLYEAAASADGFAATATRVGSPSYAGSIAVDQQGVLTGGVAGGGAVLSPGFR